MARLPLSFRRNRRSSSPCLRSLIRKMFAALLSNSTSRSGVHCLPGEKGLKGRTSRFDRRSVNGRNRRNRAVATRPGGGPDSAPTRPIHGGASRNAPGSGTPKLTKLDIRPDLGNDEIAGWRRRGHRDADARRGARFIPVVGRYRTTATWRLSFHCGMNAADTLAWQGASSLRVTSSRV